MDALVGFWLAVRSSCFRRKWTRRDWRADVKKVRPDKEDANTGRFGEVEQLVLVNVRPRCKAEMLLDERDDCCWRWR